MNIIGIAAIVVAAFLLVICFIIGYTKASPDEAVVISGIKRQPRFLIGKAGFRVPFFERKDKLILKLIPIDVKTSSEVPTADYINIKVDSVVNVKISPTKIFERENKDGKREPIKFLHLAAQNFLNKKSSEIAEIAREVLEGNLREIVGKMNLQDMVNDRQKFAEEVRNNASPDLAAMGLEIVSFNVQNFEDRNGVIENLGIDNIVKIKKGAAIAKAQAEKDIATAQAEADSASNEAKVKAQQEIAERENLLNIKKAELKAAEDLKKAEADAAYCIKEQEQREILEAKTVKADIAKSEQEVLLNEKKAAVREKMLDAEIKRTAEANKFAEQQKADAELYARQRDAEAKKYEIAQEAEAKKLQAIAEAEATKAKADATKYAYTTEAEGIKAKGEAEAAAIQAKAEAEAAGTLAKANAMKEYGDAAKQEQQLEAAKYYFDKLPEIAKAMAEGYTKVDKITMYGDGSASKFIEGMISSMGQLNDGLTAGMGLDIKGLLNSVVGGKAAGAKIAKDVKLNIDN